MKRIFKNFLLFLVCVVLAATLGYLLVDYRQQAAMEEERLEQLVSEEKKKKQSEPEVAAEFNEEENQAESEEVIPVQEEPQNVFPTQAPETKEESELTSAEVPEEQEEAVSLKMPEGIACWGDELLSEQNAAVSSYAVVLQKLLTEQGYQIPVSNKTLTGTCSLTVMKMAGVPMTDIDAYIAVHTAAANGAPLSITEGTTRELTPEQMNRTDQNYIPVLFMGYYGGWNHDLNELMEQQQKVLDTFEENKDHFIIVGLPPADKTVDAAQYHAAMAEKWGEHYINCAEVTPHGVMSNEGSAELAQALMNKLKELGYLPDAVMNE